MFSSFRVADATGPANAESTKSAGRSGGRVHALVACNQCRIRKLKCSGGKERCTRCQATGSTCLYSPTPRRGRRQPFIPYSESSDDLGRLSKLTPPCEQEGEEAAPSGQKQQRKDAAGQALEQEQLSGSTTPAQTDTLSAIDTSINLQNAPTITRDISSSALSSESESSWDSTTMDMGLHTPGLFMDDELYDFDLSVMTGASSSNNSMSETIAPSNLMSGLYSLSNPRCNSAEVPMRDAPPTTTTTTSTTTSLTSTTASPANSHPFTFPTPIPTPTAQTTAGAAVTGPVTTRNGPADCRCLGSMAQLLEEIGVRRGAGSQDAAGIDGLLMCLHLGTHACNDVLACARCRLCSQYSMLVVTVLQQLGEICRDLGDLLAASPQAGQERQRDGSVDMVAMGESQGGGGGDLLPRQRHETLLDGTIWFGRYSIKTPKMRDSLVQNLIMLHLADLRALLRRFKNEIGRKRGRWELVVQVEAEVERVYGLAQETGMASLDETAYGSAS